MSIMSARSNKRGADVTDELHSAPSGSVVYREVHTTRSSRGHSVSNTPTHLVVEKTCTEKTTRKKASEKGCPQYVYICITQLKMWETGNQAMATQLNYSRRTESEHLRHFRLETPVAFHSPLGSHVTRRCGDRAEMTPRQ